MDNKKMLPSVQKVKDVETECVKKYRDGYMIFRAAVTHIIDVGFRHMTEESVKVTYETIREKAEKLYAETGMISVMTPDFECAIVEIAFEIAKKCEIYDFMKYIKEEFEID